MAEKALQLEVYALGRSPIRVEAAQVTLEGEDGEFTVLPGHAALIATLALGVVDYETPAGEAHAIAVNGGFVEVLNDRVNVLTRTAETDTEIDVARAEASKARAEGRIEQQTTEGEDPFDLSRAEIALKRSLVRLNAHRRGMGNTGAGPRRKA